MKYFILAALLAVAFAQEQAPGPTEADQAPHSIAQAPHTQRQAPHSIPQAAGPGEAETNAANADRQHGVNVNALHYGGGVGTAPYYGVPGTDLKGVHNDGIYYGHGYGHNGAYGYGGYGHGYYGQPGGFYGGYYHAGY